MNRKEFVQKMGLSAMLLGFSSYQLLAVNKPSGLKYDEQKCKQVWRDLCGKHADKDYLRYIGPKKGLPNVLIYGDSISQGYTETVRCELKNKVSVFRLYKNGGPSSSVIQRMEYMHKTMFQPYLDGGWDFEWDLIHFNVGLHDLKYVFEGKYDKVNGTQVTSPEQYKKNLVEIIQYFKKEFPKAKLIYALTTPVPEGSGGRKAGSAVIFNKAALEVLENYQEIAVNDLHAFSKPNIEEWVMGPGNVHFNDIGRVEQGKQVAKIILGNL